MFFPCPRREHIEPWKKRILLFALLSWQLQEKNTLLFYTTYIVTTLDCLGNGWLSTIIKRCMYIFSRYNFLISLDTLCTINNENNFVINFFNWSNIKENLLWLKSNIKYYNIFFLFNCLIVRFFFFFKKKLSKINTTERSPVARSNAYADVKPVAYVQALLVQN